MKKLMLLSVLMMALGLNADGRVASSKEAASGAPREHLDARPGYKHGTAQQVNALAEKNLRNEKRLLRAGPTDEVEVKRLKLVFLLMMSLGQYRTPVY